MAKRRTPLHPDAPLLHELHKRPVTRRDFLGQGLIAGSGMVMAPSLFSMFAAPGSAQAALSGDIAAINLACGATTQGAGKIPFICFDLAGGANIAGSNVLVGKQGGQMDFLTTSGYSKLGLPGDVLPGQTDANDQVNNTFIDSSMGLAFHKDSAFLRGILEKTSVATRANINGAVIPARSDNDTGNNPHNPMYGINKAGADGSLLTLIGSRNSDSGGNSMSPATMIDPSVRPTKVDRASDVTGLVDTGKLVGLLSKQEAVAVLESMARISDKKMPAISSDTSIQDLVRCGYVKSADLVDRFGGDGALDPLADPFIIQELGGTIFSLDDATNDREFRKTAAVMKMVMSGYAGAGTISMGGYDYHTGDRSTGELRDLRAGRCMGACLEYASLMGMPLMMYVCSDGSVASNGALDNSTDGRGKGVWTGDNSSTAASFFMVYDPNAGGVAPALFTGDNIPAAQHQQIGYFRGDGSVETASSPAANNVNLLVETVILNYMALHGEQANFPTLFPTHGLGNAGLIDSLTAFDPIVNGVIGG